MTKEKHKCPVCGAHDFEFEGSFEICPICFWQDDCIQEDSPDELGSNGYTLNYYKARFDSLNREARMRFGKDFVKMRLDGDDRSSFAKRLKVRYDADGNNEMNEFSEHFERMSNTDA